MIRKRFSFERPDTLEDATALLAGADGSAKVLGGGSVLVSAMSAGLEAPGLVLDPVRLGLDSIVVAGDTIAIGARATYAALTASEIVRTRLPLLAAMVREVTGGPGLWNLATLGGAACYANPASDGPGCLAALEASFRLVSVRGARLVPAKTFFRGPFATDRAPGEILTEIVVPSAGASGRSAYFKLKHGASSWPIVTASSLLVEGPDGPRLRVCLGGAAPVPVVAEWAGLPSPDPGRIERYAREIADQVHPEWTDELAGPGYRRAVSATMAARALRAILEPTR